MPRWIIAGYFDPIQANPSRRVGRRSAGGSLLQGPDKIEEVSLILPILPGGRIASATVGPPVPAAAALGRELRQSLPPALVEALDKIGDQIEVEILDPLLCAASVEQLARTFERVFAKFRDYYVSTVLIMWGFLQEDAQRFSALTIR